MNKVLSKITDLVNKMSLFIGCFSVVSLIAMTVIICADVFMRLVFQSPIKWAYETLQLILLVAIFCGMAYTQCQKGHVHVLVVVTWIPKRAGLILYGTMELLTTIAAFILTSQCLQQTIRVYKAGNVTISGMLPWWPFQVLALIGLVAFCITLVLDVAKYYIAAFNKELAEEISF